MYAIYSKGELVSICDKPRYIKINESSGAYVEAKAGEAIGVSVGGNVYNINGGSFIAGAPDAVVTEMEGGELIFDNMSRIETVNAVTGIAFVTMAEKGEIDDVTAGEHAELFSAWIYPAAYKKGDIRKYGTELYRCLQEHTSQADWTPDAAVSLWVRISDPAEEWPKWSQPVGAHDAYNKGDQVSHNGKHWTSAADANVWEPGVYGWTEEEGE